MSQICHRQTWDGSSSHIPTRQTRILKALWFCLPGLDENRVGCKNVAETKQRQAAVWEMGCANRCCRRYILRTGENFTPVPFRSLSTAEVPFFKPTCGNEFV